MRFPFEYPDIEQGVQVGRLVGYATFRPEQVKDDVEWRLNDLVLAGTVDLSAGGVRSAEVVLQRGTARFQNIAVWLINEKRHRIDEQWQRHLNAARSAHAARLDTVTSSA